MVLRVLQLAAVAALTWGAATAASAQDFSRQAIAARELRQICEADGARLWRASLCGPLIIVDPDTRTAWASQADPPGVLQPVAAGGWAGVLPPGIPIANTSLDWGGVRWIMIAGPLPDDQVERKVLLAHEAWHRVQASMGLPPQEGDNTHLETDRGRYLLRLEMRALSVALRSGGGARRHAIQHAIGFRMARLAEHPGAAAAEASLDRNEGLASYTGVRLGAGDEAEAFAARRLDDYDSRNSLARAYAYATGPAHGLLLDWLNPDWRTQLGSYSPADLLAIAAQARPMDARRMARTAERYGGPAISAEERVRGERRRARIAELRRQYGEGPRLELPLRSAQFEFDPTRVTPVDGLGSLYQTVTLRDAWGEFRASQGAMISADFRRLTAASPGPDGLSGPGWLLMLNPGYRVTPTLGGAWRVELDPVEPPDAP
jgi:hypothetical protein